MNVDPISALEINSREETIGSNIGMPTGSLVCETFDFNEAQTYLSSIYCPYSYEVLSKKAISPVVVHEAHGNQIGLSSLSYGSRVAIRPERFERFLLVTSTIKGTADIQSAGQRLSGAAGTTAVISPEHPVEFLYGENNTQITVRIETEILENLCMQLFGAGNPAPFGFKLKIEDNDVCIRWHRLLAYYCQLLDSRSPAAVRKMLIGRTEEMMIITLLTETAWRKRDALIGQHTAAVPAQVRRAIDYIEEFAQNEMTLADIASAARCSIRSLQRSFCSFRNTTPMQYLKYVRLCRVRAAILKPEEGDNVTTIAVRFGFIHLGQFSTDYKKAFGESPSQTFRNQRRLPSS